MISLTDAGDRIARNAPDRAELIRRAAIAPPIHRDILAHYGAKGLPQADDLLRSYLVWQRPLNSRFNEASVDAFIARFRKTLEFSGATVTDIIPGSPDNADGDDVPPDQESASELPGVTKPPAPPKPPSQYHGRESSGAVLELPITLPNSLAVAVLRVPSQMSSADYDVLETMVKAMRASLVAKKKPNQSEDDADEPDDESEE